VLPSCRGGRGFLAAAFHFLGPAAVAFAPAVTTGQTPAPRVLSGTVVSESGEAVAGALVHLLGSRDTARTGATGGFVFSQVVGGEQILLVRALGFRPWHDTIRAQGNTYPMLRVVLQQVPQDLAEVRVLATAGKPPEFAHTTKYDDFFRRRQLRSGTFRSWEDAERGGISDLTGYLRGIPGVRVSATNNPYGETEVRLRIARCPGEPPNLAVLIDGRRIASFRRHSENRGSELTGIFRSPGDSRSTCEDCVRLAEVLSSVPFQDVLFLEFYSGPGQIPSDLDRGDYCAALVIWTR
jgi:hypothetical protein